MTDVTIDPEEFDLFDDALQDDPYPVLEQLREACPVSHSGRNGGHWMVSRFDDMREVLRDHRTYSSLQPSIGPLAASRNDAPEQPPALTNLDPPLHSKYRQILAPHFTVARIQALKAHAEASADALLTALPGDRFEFMSAFALPFTCNLFLEMMGLPREDLPMILELRDAMLHPALFPPAERVDRARAAGGALYTYVLDVLAGEPSGMLGVMRAATVDDGRALTDAEIAGLGTQVLLAGVDTTATALGNLMARLATDDDARAALWATPAVTAVAVEEGLRLEPLIYGARLVTRPHQLGDVHVAADDMVLLLSGAANRDPRRYEDPDAFRLDRVAPADHLSFGFGIHRCLGIHLARMELITAVDALRRHWAWFALADDDAPVRHFAMLSGIYRLPLTVQWR